jgi:uncharacterized protein
MSLDVQASSRTELEPTVLDTEPSAEPGPLADGMPETNDDIGSLKLSHPRPEPVVAAERYFAVDVLRGFALLGILAMNIVGFGWPEAAYENPFRGGDFVGLDRAVWFFNHMFFEAKMMTIFSMLFGAGLVLMDQRAEKRGARIRGVYYRRILWLLVIGLIHSYLIWWGDILVLYAECGLLLYFFRNMKPRTLIILGLSAMLLLVPLVLGIARGIDNMRAASARYEAQVKAGEKHRGVDHMLHDFWTENLRDEILPSTEKKAKDWKEEMEIHRGGYLGIVKHRAPDLLKAQLFGFFFGIGFFAMSRMLVGMGLMKLGVFSAQRSRRFYWWMVGLGYGIGLPLMVFDAIELIQHEFSFDYHIHGGVLYNVFGSIVVALGHVGVLMLIVRSGAIPWLTRRLAAVGRMALTNYLTHSIVCTTLFYGYGFNLFGQISRTGLVAIVLAIWIFQLIVSPIWLKYFRFGPAEWLWRSLTYWRIQPIRISLADAGTIAA